MLYVTALKRLGLDGSWNDTVLSAFLSGIDASSADDIRRFLQLVVEDHGLVADLTLGSMEKLDAELHGRDVVPVFSFVSVSPVPRAIRWGGLAGMSGDPADTLLRQALYGLAYAKAVPDAATPFPVGPWIGGSDSSGLDLGLACDGVVPSSSQTLAGKAHGVVLADHLDVVGHFDGPGGGGTFFKSGASFDAARFGALWSAVADAILSVDVLGPRPRGTRAEPGTRPETAPD